MTVASACAMECANDCKRAQNAGLNQRKPPLQTICNLTRPEMPHSISPETRPPSEPMETDDQQDGSSSPIPTPGDSDAMDVSQSGAPDVDKKVDVKLEDLFQTDDEDEEFLSSAPTGAAPASSSPLPDAAYDFLALATAFHDSRNADDLKTCPARGQILRPRNHARLLPAPLPLPAALPMAEPFRQALQRLCASRVRFHPVKRCLPPLPKLYYPRTVRSCSISLLYMNSP